MTYPAQAQTPPQPAQQRSQHSSPARSRPSSRPSPLSKEAIIAGPGFNRWMVPPAALAVHLCIGQAYAFSVFNEPLTRIIGVTSSAPGDWQLTTLGWVFSLAIFFLGISAAFAGKWLEKVGPRRTMFTAACCFGGGLPAGAGYLAAPDLDALPGIRGAGRHRARTGLRLAGFDADPLVPGPARHGHRMAIMGFGGGAMIGAPLSVALMNHFKTATSAGVAQTFLVMGVIYFISMSLGALAIRIPAPGWTPPGYVPTTKASKMVTHAHVHIDQALKTPQFYLLWVVLFLNITAGIGVLGQAAVMIQETFKGTITAAAAAGFVGLLSIGNMTGRFLWSSASDYFGRKVTYAIFFAFGAALYMAVPAVGTSGNVALFVACYFLILTMYGGGFSTIPAYLADMFGTAYVGGIHGRLLTAWAAAGIAGPALVNYIREHKLALGVPRSEVYVDTLHIMAGLLVVGFVCNLLIRPVHERHHLREAASAA